MSSIPPVAPIEREEGNTLSLAGHLDYKPAFAFPQKIMDALQDILDARCEIGGGENPDVLATWITWSREPESLRIAWRSEILLYRDAGDWAEESGGHWEGMGVLFCRRDRDHLNGGPLIYRVHIPDAPVQDALLAGLGFIDDVRLGSPDKLLFLRSYLLGCIDKDAAWTELRQMLGELALGEDTEEA